MPLRINNMPFTPVDLDQENNVPEPEETLTPQAATSPNKTNLPKRYGSIFREFMAYTNELQARKYPEGHTFTNEELLAITPEQVLRYFKFKLFGDGDIDIGEGFQNPLLATNSSKKSNGSHHTIDYYKKAISSFMPQRDKLWDEIAKQGNPTRSRVINDFICRIRELNGVESRSSKKRKKKDNNSRILPIGKKPRGNVEEPTFDSSNDQPNEIMSTILLQMHQQNRSVIDFLGTLGNTIENFKTSMEEKNDTIMSNLLRLNGSLRQQQQQQQREVNASSSLLNNNLPPTAAAAAAAGGRVVPIHKAAAAAAAAATTQLPSRPTNPNDWFYDHSDGTRRSVPEWWTFPSGSLLELYILWHCGDRSNHINPMKTFTNADVSFCGKRSRASLSEARVLVAKLDREVEKAGGFIRPNMSETDVAELFELGVKGMDIPMRTPTGRERNIYSLSWRTLVEKGGKKKSLDAEKEEEEEEEVGLLH